MSEPTFYFTIAVDGELLAVAAPDRDQAAHVFAAQGYEAKPKDHGHVELPRYTIDGEAFEATLLNPADAPTRREPLLEGGEL